MFGDAAGFGDIDVTQPEGSASNGTATAGIWAGGFGDAAGFGDAGGFWIERRAKRR